MMDFTAGAITESAILRAPDSMQAYLDWEFGLVEQLGRDATHGFVVV